MRILRDPGAEVVVGLLSFAVSFIAVGLSLTAIGDGALYASWTAMSIGALLFGLAILALVVLLKHAQKVKGHVRQIGAYLREGYQIRQQIMSDNREVPTDAAHEWAERVQGWLDSELPDNAPEFELEIITNTGNEFQYNSLNDRQNRAVLLIEGRVTSLREILREVRTT